MVSWVLWYLPIFIALPVVLFHYVMSLDVYHVFAALCCLQACNDATEVCKEVTDRIKPPEG